MKKVVKINESQLYNIIDNIIKEQSFLLNEDTVLFRKMTLKTKFSFGKYRGHTVEDVIRLDHTAYLRGIYYDIEGITFTDDILEIIGVFGDNYDYRIKKPGKNSKFGKKVNNEKINRTGSGNQKRIKDMKRKIYTQYDNFDKKSYSKGNLQRWNHGN
jgi:hypothetical protein